MEPAFYFWVGVPENAIKEGETYLFKKKKKDSTYPRVRNRIALRVF